jgi:hypothetical protein
MGKGITKNGQEPLSGQKGTLINGSSGAPRRRNGRDALCAIRGSLGAERLANHGMALRTPLITAPAGRYQGAPRSSRPLGGICCDVTTSIEKKSSADIWSPLWILPQ